jgi:hypothetical protein
MCSAPTCHVTNVTPSIDSPHQAVILRDTPEYQCPWFQFYRASNFYCMTIAAEPSSPSCLPPETRVTATAAVASAAVAVANNNDHCNRYSPQMPPPPSPWSSHPPSPLPKRGEETTLPAALRRPPRRPPRGMRHPPMPPPLSLPLPPPPPPPPPRQPTTAAATAAVATATVGHRHHRHHRDCDHDRHSGDLPL